jgi:hypothetical protein
MSMEEEMPTKRAPLNGWPMLEAAQVLCPAHWALVEKFRAEGDVPRERLAHADFLAQFHRRMEKGDYVAIGFDLAGPLDQTRTLVPPEVWAVCHAVIDGEGTTGIPAGSITNLPGGRVLSGIRVMRATPAATAIGQMPPAEQAKIWVLAHLRTMARERRTVSQTDEWLIQQCKHDTGCTHEDVIEAYRAAPPEIRNLSPNEKRGRKSPKI